MHAQKIVFIGILPCRAMSSNAESAVPYSAFFVPVLTSEVVMMISIDLMQALLPVQCS